MYDLDLTPDAIMIYETLPTYPRSIACLLAGTEEHHSKFWACLCLLQGTLQMFLCVGDNPAMTEGHGMEEVSGFDHTDLVMGL